MVYYGVLVTERPSLETVLFILTGYRDTCVRLGSESLICAATTLHLTGITHVHPPGYHGDDNLKSKLSHPIDWWHLIAAILC